jgi:hypothetical protein
MHKGTSESQMMVNALGKRPTISQFHLERLKNNAYVRVVSARLVLIAFCSMRNVNYASIYMRAAVRPRHSSSG